MLGRVVAAVVIIVVVVNGVGGGDVYSGDVWFAVFFADKTARNALAVCRSSIAAYFPPLSPSLPGFHTQ